VALAQECLHVLAPRIAEHGNEQHHAGPLLAEPHPILAEVDLQLMPGCGLEPHRRDLGSALGLAMRSNDPLHRPRVHRHTLLREQVCDDDSIALGCRYK
jgi:hypothetical protein